MIAPVDHRVLDGIANHLNWVDVTVRCARRESECVEFQDDELGQWFEIVVRPIDEPSTPDH